MKSPDNRVPRRSLLLLTGLLLLFLIVTLRYGYLMVFSSIKPSLSLEAIASVGDLDLPRGKITDNQGNILATSIQRFSLYANPRAIEHPREVARRLGPLLDRSPRELHERLTQDRYFVWLQRKLRPSLVEKIRSLELEHVGFAPEYERVYPKQQLAAHVLGFVGIDDQGLGGVEKQFDDLLSAAPDPEAGRLQRNPLLLRLTLNQTIQHIVEEELQRLVQREDPKHAMAVVMEPRTGKVRAMASWPGFDPNHFQEYDQENRLNRAISSSFEPGSTLKVMTLSTGLAVNAFSPDSTFNSPGYIYLPRSGHTIQGHCHGTLTVPQILIQSCNVGTVKALSRVSPSTFYQHLRSFGFGNWTGIRLPGEARGSLRKPSGWSSLTQPSIAIGQGISTTSLQLTTALASIVNDGVLMKPLIVEAVRRGDRLIEDPQPFEVRQVLPGQVARLMKTYMAGVVNKGTGRKAYSSRFPLAGKTGTAQKANLEEGGYYEDRVLASFIGFGPVKRPELVAAVVVDEPKKGRYGGDVAAPVFRRIMERSLHFLRQDHL